MHSVFARFAYAGFKFSVLVQTTDSEMFGNSNRIFLLCFVIDMSLWTVEGLAPPRENDKFLLKNITRIWRAVDPKVTTIILHDVADENTCYGICNHIGTKGPITTATFDHLENCSLNPQQRISTKRMVLFIYTGKECPTAAESQTIIDIMQTQCWWLQRAHLLYLLATTALCDDVKFIYQQFWNLRILRMSIVTYDLQHTGNLTLHKCNPFTKSCERIRDPSITKPFTDGVLNMNGFELKRTIINTTRSGSVVQQQIESLSKVATNIDINIVNLLTEQLNATKKTKKYFKYNNISDVDGSLGFRIVNDIGKGKSDILTHSAFNSPTTVDRDDHVESTTFSEFSRLCAIVPINYQVMADQLEGILIFLGIILCIVGIAYIVSSLLRFQSEAGTPFDIYLILVGGGLSHPPSRSSPRIFLITWLLSSMFLSTAMQNHLMSSLIIKPKPTHIKTLAELDASGRILLAHPRVAHIIFLRPLENSAILRIRDRSEPYRSLESNCAELIRGSWKANATCLLETPTALWFIKTTMRDNLPVFTITEECFFSQYKGFLTSRGSPYLPSINKLLLRMHDFGILTRLIEDTWLAIPYTSTQSTKAVDSEFSAISWDSLRQAFFLILGGECVAAVIFCLELIVHYVTNTKKM